jgi:hypothetical protein
MTENVGTQTLGAGVTRGDRGGTASGAFAPAKMLLIRIQYAPGAAGQYGFKLLRRQPLFASRS